jgi:hypothetical protein
MNETCPEPSPAAGSEPGLAPRRLALPWDFSEWVAREHLWQWTVEEVDRLGWDQPELVSYLRERPNYQPRLLLCLLGFAYCVGIFEDGEVADLPMSDVTMRSSVTPPSKREVSSFRKANRGLIKWVLVQVFRRILHEHYQIEGMLLPAGLKRYLVRAASARLDLARTMVRATEEA